jgi:uncharacterized protein (TIGR02231 family)
VTEQAKQEIKSVAVRVTLFEDRAEVLRRAQVQVAAGISWVSIAGVTTLIDDPSVLCNVRGGAARVLASRVLRRVREVPLAAAGELAAAEADKRAATARRNTAERAAEVAATQERRHAAFLSQWIEALQRVPRTRQTGVGPWRTAFTQLSEAHLQALELLQAAQAERDSARRDEQRALQRVTQARRTEPRHEAAIELQLDAAAAAELTLELTYRTPCALWRPEHLGRLTQTADGGAQLQLTTSAVVWQRTGEQWEDVQCRFSTARPTQLATPPLLSEDALRLRRKTEQERRTTVVEARDQSIAIAGLADGARAAAEMPGVDDCGEPLLLEAGRPATLPATGQPIRVELGTLTLPCQVDRICYPERGPAAHLRATATLNGPRPLLAGPIAVVRNGELCGRGRLPFVGRGEPFEVGFGTDDGVRVRRQVQESREVTPVVGTQKLTRTVKLFVSNLSSTPRQLSLTERLPVSELREVEVTLLSSTGLHFDPKDGFAKFPLELPPRATRELQLVYRIEAPARVVLPTL